MDSLRRTRPWQPRIVSGLGVWEQGIGGLRVGGNFEVLECRRLLAVDAVAVPVASHVAGPRRDLPNVGDQIRSAITADLNRDGRLDYIVDNATTKLGIFLGGINNTIRPPQNVTISGEIADLEVGDLNGDGWTDLMVASDRHIVPFLNQGVTNETWKGFQAGSAIPGASSSILVLDVDGDSQLDLVASRAQGVDVQSGRGNGSFDGPVQYTTLVSARLDAADVTADGHLDLALLDIENKRVVVLQNDGNGVFEQTVQVVALGEIPATLAIEDVDGDPYPELLVGFAQQEGHNLAIWPGKVGGGFGNEPSFHETYGHPQQILAADLNEDGRKDLVVGHAGTFHHPIVNNGPGGVSVFYGLERGGFSASLRLATPTPAHVTLVDENQDSQPEILFVSQFTFEPEIGILAPAVNRYFASTADLFHFDLPPQSYLSATHANDLNRDGITDLLLISNIFREDGISTLFQFYLGDDAGNFRDGDTLKLDYAIYQSIAADFTGDGDDELFVIGPPEQSNSSMMLVIDDLGQFSNPIPSLIDSKQTVASAKAVDVNRDGKSDLLLQLSTEAGTQLATSLGAATGVMQNLIVGSTLGFANEPLIKDVNRDGWIDVVMADFNGVGQLFWGRGDGSFASGPKFSGNSTFVMIDGNQDGLPDLLGGSLFDKKAHLYLAVGDGTFQRPITINLPMDVNSWQVADLNGQGKEQLIVSGPDSVVVYDVSIAGLTSRETYHHGLFSDRVLVQDLDGNSVLDLLAVQPEATIGGIPTTQLVVIPRGVPTPEIVMLSLPVIQPTGVRFVTQEGGESLVIQHRTGIAYLARSATMLRGDFDGNLRINALDIDLLCRQVAIGGSVPNGSPFDLKVDGKLDQLDVDVLVEEILGSYRGDLDLDHDVDFEDFLQLASNYGRDQAIWSQGEVDCDGVIGFSDFLELSSNFGKQGRPLR